VGPQNLKKYPKPDITSYRGYPRDIKIVTVAPRVDGIKGVY